MLNHQLHQLIVDSYFKLVVHLLLQIINNMTLHLFQVPHLLLILFLNKTQLILLFTRTLREEML